MPAGESEAADVAMGLRVERVASIEALREEWRPLSESAGSPFSTWEWAAAWWNAFGAGRELMLHVTRRPSGEAVAVLPLYMAVDRGPLRVARFIGHGPGPQLGPVCAPRDRAATAAALKEVVRAQLGMSGVLLGERLAGDEGWTRLLRGRRLAQEPSPLLAIDGGTWDEWLSSKSRNFREQVRRRERKLTHEHEISFRLAQDRDEIEGAFATLIELHETRWAGASRAFVGARLGFHWDFVRRAADRGWARVWLLHVDGRPAAAWYGLRFGNADWYCQAGRAPELERENVGFVLLCHTVRDAFACGRREYRFLVGDEPYKSRFRSDDPGLDTIAVSAGPGALAAQAAVSFAARLPRPARRLIRRRTA